MDNPKDNLFWRRLLMIGSIIFMFIWAYTILVCDIFFGFETGDLLAYYSIIALPATNIYKYLKACEVEDQNRGKNHDGTKDGLI